MNPRNAGALASRAIAYFHLFNYAQAIADYDAVIAIVPISEFFQVRAGVYKILGNKVAAIADYDEAVRLKPKDPDPYAGRADAYDWFNDAGPALADYTMVVRLRPNEAEGYRQRAEHYVKAGKFDLAIADADTAIRLEPSPTSYLARASIHSQNKDHDKALADADEAVRLAPQSAQALSTRANIFEAKGESDRAVTDANAIVEANPGNANAFIARGAFFASRKNVERAIADFNEAIRLEPRNPHHYARRAIFYISMNDPERALADYETAARIDPQFSIYSQERSEALTYLGDLDRALALAEKAVRLNPHSVQTLTQRGAVYLKKKDYDKALADFNEAIRLAPDSIEAVLAYHHRAEVFSLKGDYKRSLDDYERMLQRHPDKSGVYIPRSLVRLLAGDIEGALADANEAIRIKPDGWSHGVRGTLYAQLGRWDDALKDADEALSRQPQNAILLSSRARALLKLGRTEEALTGAELALRTGNHRDSALIARGQVLTKLNRAAGAVEDFSEAIALGRDDPAIYAARGTAYEQLGMRAEALADYRKATQLPVTSLFERDERIRARARLAELEAGKPSVPETTGAPPKQPAAKPAEMGRRIALVIGIGAYKAQGRLRNPPNDAKAIAAALRRLRFTEVTQVVDASRAELLEAVKSFGDRARNADWAVVFYAGHGIQVDGRNFLLPADARFESSSEVEQDTLPLDRVMDAVSGARKLGLVMLDACRDNPFLKDMTKISRSTQSPIGLAPIEPKHGELIAYATKDGHVASDGTGANSPFTEGILEHIGEADVDIRFMFGKVRESVRAKTGDRQRPFVYSSLPGEGFFFNVSAQ
jgi:tetratricopeptide (TPR) repeat protein